jgi:hypothetical protein
MKTGHVIYNLWGEQKSKYLHESLLLNNESSKNHSKNEHKGKISLVNITGLLGRGGG